MKSVEEMIWDKVTDSAKTRFDYLSFERDFPFDPDMIIFNTIIGYAAGKEKKIIVAELFSEMLLIGYTWDRKDLTQFVEEKEDLFKLEIFVTKLAADMLSQDSDPLVVYNTISQLL